MIPLFLCVDCGGTKAAAVIADANANILGKGFGGPANYKDLESSVFLKSVKTAVENSLGSIDHNALPTDLKQTLVQANFDPETPKRLHRISLPTKDPLFAAVWVGCAGVDHPQDITDLTPLLSELFSIPSSSPSPIAVKQSRSQHKPQSIPRLIIDNDTALLAAPLHHHTPLVTSAVVAIAGTGCIVVSFKMCPGDGEARCFGRSGGWGWILGDEGSGFFIGREALRRILEGADNERATEANASPRSDALSASPSSAGLAFSMPLADIEIDETAQPSSPRSTRPPTLQERVFSHYGIAQPADILTVVYAPDPPCPVPIRTAPGWMRQASSPLPPPTVVSAPVGGSPGADDVPFSPDPMAQTFKAMPSSSPRALSASPIAPAGAGYANIDRKARVTALAPIVFDSAFVDGDEVALDILESSGGAVARLIARNLGPPPPATQARPWSGSKSARESREASTAEHLETSSSVLCLGGSLLGVPEYRTLVLKHLKRLGHVFPYVEYVPDAAQAGVLRLVAMYGAGAATSENHGGTTRESTSP